jgi:hypothetical protein
MTQSTKKQPSILIDNTYEVKYVTSYNTRSNDNARSFYFYICLEMKKYNILSNEHTHEYAKCVRWLLLV